MKSKINMLTYQQWTSNCRIISNVILLTWQRQLKMLAKPATEAWVTRTHSHLTTSSFHYGMQPTRCRNSHGVCHQDPGFSRGAKGFNSLTQTEKCSYWIYGTFGLNGFLRLPKYKSHCSVLWELTCCCETTEKLGSPYHAECNPGLQVLQNLQFWLHWVPCKHMCLRQRDKTDL